ncbi:MAG: hypothetical protein BMS9Abin28_0893 [Anaerolineae bacterium]|nr:MAG: hypothetical protein BMS9Abin28_0893 [Anaerolineae bacterium]
MTNYKSILQKALIALSLVGLLAFPFSVGPYQWGMALNMVAQAQVEFTPDIDALEMAATPEPLLQEKLELPEAFVEGNVLVIDGNPYPIGDGFYDAEGIPLGPSVTDKTGLYGYAPIQTLPDHVLIWYLDGTGKKQYLVTTADDELLTGSTGFDQMIKNLRDAEDRLITTAGGGAAALVTAAVLQLAVCPSTVGATCVTGVVTLIVAAIGATFASAARLLFDIVPAMNNVESAFATLDQNRP